jgi:hypothetical protein
MLRPTDSILHWQIMRKLYPSVVSPLLMIQTRHMQRLFHHWTDTTAHCGPEGGTYQHPHRLFLHIRHHALCLDASTEYTGYLDL